MLKKTSKNANFIFIGFYINKERKNMINKTLPVIIKNGEKIITSKKDKGFEIINTWMIKSDRCDLVSKQIKDEFVNITQELEESNFLKGLRITGELNSCRLGVNIHQVISGFIRGKESFINLPIKELVKELFNGKFDAIIDLQKGNKGRRIWKMLDIVDYVLNENEIYSLENMGGKTFVNRAIFPNFKYNGMILNTTKDFDINKLSPKAQTIAKLAIKQYEEFIK